MVNLYTLFGDGAETIIVSLTSEEDDGGMAMILNSSIIKDKETRLIEAESFLEKFPEYVGVSCPTDEGEKIMVYKGGISKNTQ